MEITILKFIQQFMNPALNNIFEFISFLGEETIIIPVLAFIYWLIDKKKGELIAFSIFTTFLINNFLKEIFNLPRPIGEEGIITLRKETATGASFPSGHTQAATTALATSRLIVKKKWFRNFAITLSLLIGLSRLYLGVHYPKDVLAGLALGLIISLYCFKIFQKSNKKVYYLSILIMSLLALIFNQSSDMIKAVGSYSGFILGIFLENNYINFKKPDNKIKGALRFLFGIILVLAVKEGFKVILPTHILSDYLRYLLLVFTAIGLWPLIFNKIKL